MICNCGLYKISVNIPVDCLEDFMDSVSGAIEPLSRGYRRVFTYYPVESTWIPQNDAEPYIGKIEEKSVIAEVKVEFAIRESDLAETLNAIRKVHPYEEPAIDIMPMVRPGDIIRP